MSVFGPAPITNLLLLHCAGAGRAKVTSQKTTVSRNQIRAIRHYRLCLLSNLFSLLVLSSPAAGFDTFWHAQATQAVGNEFGFTPDATNVMKLGNFSPDLFGPVEDYAAKHLNSPQRQSLHAFGVQNAQPRAAAVFLHFDNLNGKLVRNSQ